MDIWALIGGIFGWVVWAGFAFFLGLKLIKFFRIHRCEVLWQLPPEPEYTDPVDPAYADNGAYYVSALPQVAFGVALLWLTWGMTWARLLIIPVGYIGFIIIYGPAAFFYGWLVAKKNPRSTNDDY